jgi:hypothetical protein
MSHNPVGLHGLLQEYALRFTLLFEFLTDVWRAEQFRK